MASTGLLMTALAFPSIAAAEEGTTTFKWGCYSENYFCNFRDPVENPDQRSSGQITVKGTEAGDQGGFDDVESFWLKHAPTFFTFGTTFYKDDFIPDENFFSWEIYECDGQLCLDLFATTTHEDGELFLHIERPESSTFFNSRPPGTKTPFVAMIVCSSGLGGFCVDSFFPDPDPDPDPSSFELQPVDNIHLLMLGQFTAVPVPEPGTYALLITMMAVPALYRNRYTGALKK